MLEYCPCGAIYSLTEVHIQQRDKDSIECQFCKRTIKKWSGSTIYLEQLISAPKSFPYKKND